MAIFKKIILVILIFIVLIVTYFVTGEAPKRDEISWGVTFSQKYARDLGLDWEQAYLEILDNLGVKKIRIPIYQDLVEVEKGNDDYWEEAKKLFD